MYLSKKCIEFLLAKINFQIDLPRKTQNHVSRKKKMIMIELYLIKVVRYPKDQEKTYAIKNNFYEAKNINFRSIIRIQLNI